MSDAALLTLSRWQREPMTDLARGRLAAECMRRAESYRNQQAVMIDAARDQRFDRDTRDYYRDQAVILGRWASEEVGKAIAIRDGAAA